MYPHVLVGLKSAFFQDEAVQQQEPDIIRYLVRLYDISREGDGGKRTRIIIFNLNIEYIFTHLKYKTGKTLPHIFSIN